MPDESPRAAKRAGARGRIRHVQPGVHRSALPPRWRRAAGTSPRFGSGSRSAGSTPARISPDIAPGRLISPTTFVESIAGISAVRKADRWCGKNASRADWPRHSRASSSVTRPSGRSGRPTRTSLSTASVSTTGACATRPTRRRNTSTSRSVSGTPSSQTFPDVGSMSRFSNRSSVVFPDPLAPRTALQRPAGKCALTCRSTVASSRTTLTRSSRKPCTAIRMHQPHQPLCGCIGIMTTAGWWHPSPGAAPAPG